MQSITEKLGAPPVLPSVGKTPSLRELSLRITVSTPMAGGGVEAGIVDTQRPVRVPSIRGHLRYWWRMMNMNRQDKDERESEIWGSTEKPGKVYVDVTEQPNVLMRYCDNNFDFSRSGPEIYALFSSLPNRQAPGKNIAHENFTFTLSLKYPEQFNDDVRLALSAWIYFGGLGARTRRGCGSLSCDKVPVTLREIIEAAPHITLWRKNSAGNNPMSAWSYAVKRYRDYRQRRNNGQENRPGRSKWPEPDSLRIMTGDYPDKHKPRNYLPLPSFPRAALGMPIIFHFKGIGEPDDVEVIPNLKDSSRMASPVITKALCDNGTWYSAVIILPHDDIFGTKLKFKTKSRITHTEEVKPLKSNEYSKLETMPGQSDAISGFEEFISGDFKKEAAI
ncbi:MAG: type III-B CRISPR module RAMP protein Cmr1 [Synergistaceae bacterium]|nr:type III-B CRISPR module RAMP protein Cmr1 [Synergistaceae bacterium]MBQ6665265.1 type III-B CRISPR module RAMP protein Cmr1 [Synergistaceae bacterium]